MKTLFTAEAISKGGRPGSIRSSDGLLNVTLGNPLAKGREHRGDNSVKLGVDQAAAVQSKPIIIVAEENLAGRALCARPSPVGALFPCVNWLRAQHPAHLCH